MLTKVLQPKRNGVTDVATFVVEERNIDVFELLARTFVELGHLLKLLRDRVTEGRCNVLRREERHDTNRFSCLVSERVIISARENGVLELVVAHGRVVQDFVLMLQEFYIVFLL